jgi:hypothetical protein
MFVALADMHAQFWGAAPDIDVSWCSWAARMCFLSPDRVHSLAAEGIDFGAPAGWQAFGRVADERARDIVLKLAHDPGPLVRVMRSLPATLLHGDAKVGNMGFDGDTVWLFDWSDVTIAPVGLEVGYVLAVNSSRLPWSHDESFERYAAYLRKAIGGARFAEAQWPKQRAVGVLSAMMVLGWGKANDAVRGRTDEFDWWCQETVKAADLLAL